MTDPNKASEGAPAERGSPHLSAEEILQWIDASPSDCPAVVRMNWSQAVAMIDRALRAAEARGRPAALEDAAALLDRHGYTCEHGNPGAAIRELLLGDRSGTDPKGPSSSPAVQQEGLGPPSAGSLCEVCGLEKRPWSDGMDLSCSPANRAACWERGYVREKAARGAAALAGLREAYREAACWAGTTPLPDDVEERARGPYDEMADRCAAHIVQRAREKGFTIAGFTWADGVLASGEPRVAPTDPSAAQSGDPEER